MHGCADQQQRHDAFYGAKWILSVASRPSDAEAVRNNDAVVVNNCHLSQNTRLHASFLNGLLTYYA